MIHNIYYTIFALFVLNENMTMISKKTWIFYILTFILLMNYSDTAGQDGKALYDKACIACHTIGGGRTVGPDLIGINQQREKDWLLRLIKSSQTLIKEGDATSISLFEEFMKIPMPDQNFTDSEINQILLYIDQEGGTKSETSSTDTDKNKIQEINADSNNGRELFSGAKTFKNNGATCISCHSINDEAAYYGGSFAKDLSKSYELMQKAGIESVLQYLSFPSMADTYKNNQLTSTEIADLTAFLKEVSEKKSSNKITGFGLSLLLFGFIFFMILLTFIDVFWRNNKPDSVKKHLLS